MTFFLQFNKFLKLKLYPAFYLEQPAFFPFFEEKKIIFHYFLVVPVAGVKGQLCSDPFPHLNTRPRYHKAQLIMKSKETNFTVQI